MKNVLFAMLICVVPLITSAQDLAKTRTDRNAGRDAESYRSFTFDGIWCWFSDPRAVYHEGRHKRTYAGWIDRYGDIQVGYYDHGSGEIATKVIHNEFQIDDHNHPVLLFDEDGKLMVFYSEHSRPTPTYLSVADLPEDISTLGKGKQITVNDREAYPGMRYSYTYSNPFRMEDENNRLYFFWRGMDFKPNFSTSDDGGKTWSPGRIYIKPENTYRNRRPYVKFASDGKARIHFAFTDGHPELENRNSIYYMYAEHKQLYNAGGQQIGSLDAPVQPRQADCVYDALETGHKAWIWDVAFFQDGRPALVYAKFPDDRNHIYCYAVWDGKKWNNHELVNSGSWFPETQPDKVEREPNYSGGISIDPEDPNTLYLSVNRDSVFEIEKWTTGNAGRSWRITPITKGSTKDNIRPAAVKGAGEGNPVQVLWSCLTRYVHFTDYQASIQMDLPMAPVSAELNRESVVDVMRRVGDWQIMNPRRPHKLDWHYGAFYTGLWALYKTTGEDRYKNEIRSLGEKHNWKLLNDIYHADRLTVAQSFVDLYLELDEPAREAKYEEMLEKIRWVLDMHVDRRPPPDVRHDQNPYRGEWWTWCDALYMAPPAFARVYKATGDERYLKYLDEHWWLTADYLYSTEDSLYYRDDRFFDERTENGRKLFWGRGNGWVIGGLARTIPFIPEDYENREKFIQQFREMAAKLLRIQDEDGLWRVSLDDPAYLDMGESSGSSFFTFALAWGINEGLLDETAYKPAVLKAWKSLVDNVNMQGRLGYVQQVAGSPYPFYDYQSHVYASGAFLLAGSEILKLIE